LVKDTNNLTMFGPKYSSICDNRDISNLVIVSALDMDGTMRGCRDDSHV